jgi:hypothetical protein
LRRALNWLVADLNPIRIVYWVAVVVLGIWAVAETRSRPAVPTAAQPLGVNQKIKPGDLQTPEIAALTDHFLRQPVKAGQAVTGDMVGDQAVVPVIESGFYVVVNMPQSLCEQRQIHDGQSVQIRSGKQPLTGDGVVGAVAHDDNRCAVAVRFDKAPGFDPQALQGAEVTEFHPALPKH